MNLGALRTNLASHPAKNVRFVLPDADMIPAEFHITEVGHVVRSFIDCGSTVRRLESCLLQAWVSENDSDHRLSASRLADILQASTKVVPSDDLEVEVEYEACAVAQYKVESADVADDELRFQLVHKKTDCLAREACGLAPTASGCGCGDEEGKCC
jgi:hypothetical protein